MRNRRFLRVAGLLALPAWIALGQANGKLQIHFMDVGQGDGAVLISPGGEIVLFDDGVMNQCNKPVSYLQRSARSNIYHFTNCQVVRAISASNLQQGHEPPEGKSLHKGCPR